MSRAWRIEYKVAHYHLLSCGNQGDDLFINKDDRIVFLDTLGEMSERFEMDNRDLPVSFMWRSGRLSNEQIGQLFGLGYSAISHAVKTLKALLQDNSELMRKLKQR